MAGPYMDALIEIKRLKELVREMGGMVKNPIHAKYCGCRYCKKCQEILNRPEVRAILDEEK